MRGDKPITSLLDLALAFVEAIIGIRVVLKLTGAPMTNSLVSWVYQVSGPLLKPFQGIFGPSSPYHKAELELTALLALAVYGVVGYIIIDIISGQEGKRRWPY